MGHVPIQFDLNTGDWKKTKHPGVSIRFLRADRTTGDTTVLIRMDAGCAYPQHRHVGDEEVLVLAGAYRDEAGTWRAGEYHVNRAGSVHRPAATGEGPCVLFAFAHGGIQMFEGGPIAAPRAEPRFERLIDRWADHPRVLEWHRWWLRRTDELRGRYPWIGNQKKLSHIGSRELLAFLDEETHRLSMRWPLGLFGTQRQKVAATPHLAARLDHLLWADEPLEARVDAAMFGDDALAGAGRSVTFPSLMLQTAFPDKVVGLLSLRFALQAFPMRMPPGATPGEKFALMSRTILASWRSSRPDQPLNLAHWVLWMEYAAHHNVRAAMFRT